MAYLIFHIIFLEAVLCYSKSLCEVYPFIQRFEVNTWYISPWYAPWRNSIIRWHKRQSLKVIRMGYDKASWSILSFLEADDSIQTASFGVFLCTLRLFHTNCFNILKRKVPVNLIGGGIKSCFWKWEVWKPRRKRTFFQLPTFSWWKPPNCFFSC